MSGASHWLQIDDLIGRPHKPGSMSPEGDALDCAGVVATALHRLGAHEPAGEFLRAVRQCEPLDGWDQVERMIDAAIGDVVVSDPGEPSGILHVSCIVRVGPPIAISSCAKLGVFIAPGLYIQGVIGIYRPPGLEVSP